MPEQSELFTVNKKHLIGRLITSTVPSAKIENIELPEDFSGIVVLSASDFGEHNEIDIMGEKIPIFAKEEVSYEGEPILAVFGEELEEVLLFCDAVKITYNISTYEENASEVVGEPFNWSYGNTDDYFVQGSKTLKTKFSVKRHPCSSLGEQKVFAVMDNGIMKIQLESQWPVHVRKTVANVLDLPFEKIHLNLRPFYAPFDQLIMTPSLLSCIAAKAAQKTGELVRLYAPFISWQPKMAFEFKSVVLPDGTCPAGRYKCTIDLGAFPIFSKEVCYNILSGIVPVYPLKALDVSITVVKSATPPANFFGDLGYAMALSAIENHFTQVSIALGEHPGTWKLEQLKECDKEGSPISESVRVSSNFENLSTTFEDVLKSSWYSRKYAANAQKSLYVERMTPFLNYSRGIGIATGEGIMGFSQQYNALAKYSLEMTLNEDNKVIVNSGIQTGKNMELVWKQAIKQQLDVDEDDIIFKDINDPDIIDLGPNSLSRRIGIVTKLLMIACSKLAKKKTFSRLPITVKASSEASFEDPCYFSSCFGTVAVELHIDTVSLSPVIDNIWARFHVNRVFNMQGLINKARIAIFSVIEEVLPNWSGNLNIDLEVSQDSDNTPSSVTAAVRGLTIAALVNAVSQAIGRYVNAIPLTETDILALVKGQAKQSQGSTKDPSKTVGSEEVVEEIIETSSQDAQDAQASQDSKDSKESKEADDNKDDTNTDQELVSEKSEQPEKSEEEIKTENKEENITVKDFIEDKKDTEDKNET